MKGYGAILKLFICAGSEEGDSVQFGGGIGKC